MSHTEAPVILFAFKRPDKLAQLLQKVTVQTTRHIYVFCDGARNEEDQELCLQTQQLAQRYSDSHRVEVIVRPHNYGLSKNLISGISTVLQKHPKAIIFEDDVHPKPGCIAFLDLALETYAPRDDIFSIGCYHRILPFVTYTENVFLSPRFNCWGWATWADRWHRIQEDLERDIIPFQYHDEVPSTAGLDIPARLRHHHLKERTLTWDTRVALHCLKNNWWQIQPRDVLVENVGFDGSGMNCGKSGLKLETFEGRYDQHFYAKLSPTLKPQLRIIKAIESSYEDQQIGPLRRWRRKWLDRLKMAFRGKKSEDRSQKSEEGRRNLPQRTQSSQREE